MSRLNRFSTWTKLVKTVARIQRLRTREQGDLVTVEERRRAAEAVFKLVQQQAFPQELRALQNNPQGGSLFSSSPLYRLDARLVEGLIRVGGRLNGSTLSSELKHPIILPKDSHITNLILSHYHAQICHQGRGQTLMELRAIEFWVIGGSKAVAQVHTQMCAVPVT